MNTVDPKFLLNQKKKKNGFNILRYTDMHPDSSITYEKDGVIHTCSVKEYMETVEISERVIEMNERNAADLELEQHIEELGEKFKSTSNSAVLARNLSEYKSFLELTLKEPDNYLGIWHDKNQYGLPDPVFGTMTFIGVYFKPHFVNKFLKFLGLPRFRTLVIHHRVTEYDFEKFYDPISRKVRLSQK